MDLVPSPSLDVPIRLHIRLLGPLQAWTGTGSNILPKSKKAQAILVILSITGNSGISRKRLASLLWSRNNHAEALARLRGSLYLVRRSMQACFLPGDLIEITEDRVRLKAGSFETDLPLAGTEADVGPFPINEIAADLNGIDPELDVWLGIARQRLRHPASGPWLGTSDGRACPVGPRMAAVIGIGTFTLVGHGADSSLSMGLAEEISTALARVRDVVVIAGTSVAGTVAGWRSNTSELGVDYLIEGSIYCQHRSIRIAIKLVDVTHGALVWSWIRNIDSNKLSNLQQNVAALVVAGLEPELPLIQIRSKRDRGELDQSAYSLLLRAITSIYLLKREPFLEAERLLTKAITLEPHFAPAYSWFALWNIFLVGQGWAIDPRRSIAEAGDAAEHAITLDPSDARGLAVAGHVRAFLHKRLTEAFPLYERALAINPSLPLAWHLSGVAHAYGGDLTEARKRLDQCRALAPHDPHSFFADGGLTIIELLCKDHKAAIKIGRRVVQLHPRFSAGYKPYLAALGHLGEIKEAQLVREKLLVLEPDFSVQSFLANSPIQMQEHLDHYATGLSLAGIPHSKWGHVSGRPL